MAFKFPEQSRFAILKRYRAEAITKNGGQTLVSFDGPWCLVAPESTDWFPSQNLNRVIDLATMRGSFEEQIQVLKGTYESAGVTRHFAYLDPCVDLIAVATAMSKEEYRLGNSIAVLTRSLDDVQVTEGEFVIKTHSQKSMGDLRSVLTFGGSQPPMWLDSLTGTLSEEPNSVHIAYLGSKPVAVGAVTVHAGVAYLSNALTIPEARGKGAQTALISSRLSYAKRIGCDLAFVETYSWASSYSNLMASGFAPMYQRLIYRFEADKTIRSTLKETIDGHPPPK